jgi:hypothetical protein
MCATPAEIASRASEIATSIAWRQWAALGAPVSSSGDFPHSVIDPEALLLLSCVLRGRERRLDDVLAWWAEAGAALTSVQRAATLRKAFPASASAGVGAFARAALSGGDGRWRGLSSRAEDGEVLLTRGKRGRDVQLVAAPALMLRLRAAFGVGVKADLLSVLLALDGGEATVRKLALSTGYTAAAIRRAAQEMAAARTVQGTRGRPAAFYVDARRWVALLDFGPDPDAKPPAWRYFAQVSAFLAAVLEWEERTSPDASAYVAASSARDVFEAHRAAFDLNRIRVPEPSDYRGEAYLDAFSSVVDALAAWMSTATSGGATVG